jgi:hypothetical protein
MRAKIREALPIMEIREYKNEENDTFHDSLPFQSNIIETTNNTSNLTPKKYL